MGKRFDCCTPRTKKDGGTWWHRIGSAWENDTGLVTVFLDSLPAWNEEGRIQFSLFESKEASANTKFSGGRTPVKKVVDSFAKELDDEIPF